MADNDWSGGEEEGGVELPSLDDILGSLGFDQEEYDRQIEEALGFLITEINLEQGIDPFADDADLIPEDDPFDDEGEDFGTVDYRLATSSDFEGDHRGPFPSYEDTLFYAGELPLTFWDIIYDDLDNVWYIFIPPSN